MPFSSDLLHPITILRFVRHAGRLDQPGDNAPDAFGDLDSGDDSSGEEDDAGAPDVQPEPQAGRCRDSEAAWAFDPLATDATLVLSDSHGKDDSCAWLHCPMAHSSQECTLQRAGMVVVTVLDVATLMSLKVQRYHCVTHSKYFLVTNPSVFKQLKALQIRTRPEIIPITKKSIVTAAAYECGFRVDSLVC
jgi:hypothetical protein